MTIKEKLSDYRYIQREIKNTLTKIKKLQVESEPFSVVEASSIRPPFQKHIVTICHTNPSKQRKVLYYKSILSQQYDKLLEKEIELKEFINNLPTARLRMIFELRYIEQCSWQQVSWKIGGTSTEDSVRMEHDRYLLKK